MRYSWRLGVRLGYDGHSDLNATSPGVRKAGFCEVVGVLRCPVQVGYPPRIATEALLGFSFMAYQSAEVLFDRCEGDGHILVRLTGTCTRARQGGQGKLTKRAKVGNCSCCTRLTHVAAPPHYMAGQYSGHKAHGIHLWRDFGPWAVRFFAAAAYARDSGCLSSA